KNPKCQINPPQRNTWQPSVTCGWTLESYYSNRFFAAGKAEAIQKATEWGGDRCQHDRRKDLVTGDIERVRDIFRGFGRGFNSRDITNFGKLITSTFGAKG